MCVCVCACLCVCVCALLHKTEAAKIFKVDPVMQDQILCGETETVKEMEVETEVEQEERTG